MISGILSETEAKNYTVNSCRLCAPLGACLAFRGVEGAVPFLHGSQGCATYIRRYIISHYREPIDIASSSLGETAVIFGGKDDFFTGAGNVIKQYSPSLIGVSSTCLVETVGEDLRAMIGEYKRKNAGLPGMPAVAFASTPSCAMDWAGGFHAASLSLVEELAETGPRQRTVNIFPGPLSPADIRDIKETAALFGADCRVIPDISDTMDGPNWGEFQRIPPGGTPVRHLREAARAALSIQFGGEAVFKNGPAMSLLRTGEVPALKMPVPVGVANTDRFLAALAEFSKKEIPAALQNTRGRLIDALVDGHKYVSGVKAALFGEGDLAAALAGFLSEIGCDVVLCASETSPGKITEAFEGEPPGGAQPLIMEDTDFGAVSEALEKLKPDIMIGNSKGAPAARKLGVPLVRVGFPIHDRLGAQRILHTGYKGALEIYDKIVNALIEKKQNGSSAGYQYM